MSPVRLRVPSGNRMKTSRSSASRVPQQRQIGARVALRHTGSALIANAANPAVASVPKNTSPAASE